MERISNHSTKMLFPLNYLNHTTQKSYRAISKTYMNITVYYSSVKSGRSVFMILQWQDLIPEQIEPAQPFFPAMHLSVISLTEYVNYPSW